MVVGAQGPLEDAIANAIGWLADRLDWIGNLLDPAGEILAGLWPPALAAVAAVALLRTVRWGLLLWRGRTPRVQISSFAWATSDEADREATWVTSLFREQLAALRLDALDPLPDRAPGAPLVEIVESVGQGVSRSLDLGKAAGRLFRAAWPDAAYEVWGTLRPHDDGGGKISVQLIERRRGNRTLLNVALEKASWEDGARDAAMAVAGALYPRVRRSDRGPWTLWKGTVPRKLMGNYHDARRYEEANRLEHALAAYHVALDQDPLNPNLRLKIAMLQERLELDLDAWVTYEAIVDESDRRAWRGPDRRVYLLALYRLAVMLSNGRVAAQWVKRASVETGKGTLRDDERHERRNELLMSLGCDPLFAKSRTHLPAPDWVPSTPTWITSSRIVNSPSAGLLAMLRQLNRDDEGWAETLTAFTAPSSESKAQSTRRAQKIDVVLLILSLRRLEQLDAWMRFRPPGRPRQWKRWWIHRSAPRQWLRRSEFSRSAVRTSKILVRIRIAASLERQLDAKPRDDVILEIRQAHRKLTKRWPFPPTGAWRIAIHFLAPRRRWADRRDDAWQLHYNAACATASVLREDSVTNSRKSTDSSKPTRIPTKSWRALPQRTARHDVVERAIAQLEEYAYRAGSRRVAAQADWLAIDDPDLMGLRESSEFKLWASHHLPRALPLGLSSRKADVKRFTVRVVHEGARVFATSWRDRADVDNPSAAEIVDWWRFEAEVWKALGNACREHLSWEERLKWLKILKQWLRRTEMEDRVDFSHEARGTAAADSMTQDLFDELAALAGNDDGDGTPATELPPSAQSVLPWVKERAEHVRVAHEQGEARADASGSLLAEFEREQALRTSRIWDRLADALEKELTGQCQEDSLEKLRENLQLIRDELARPISPTARRASTLSRWTARSPWSGREKAKRRDDEREDGSDQDDLVETADEGFVRGLDDFVVNAAGRRRGGSARPT